MFSPGERAALLGRQPVPTRDDAYGRLLSEAAASHPACDLMTFTSFAEARTYMHDVLLRDSDQMSMAHGLELRVPLLDHPVVEFAMGLPEAIKWPAARPKELLVRSLGENILPSEIVDRPKRGFVLPFDTWMKGSLRDMCEHYLNGAVRAAGLVSPTAAGDVWQRFLAGDRSTTWSRPWTLVALHAWAEQNRMTAA
jgi:asparagine synthase (glutamine-hydrolysing)